MAGIVYSLFLVLHNSHHVFYSDGGLKYLMVKQYSSGDFSLSLHLAKPDFVTQIWQEGFYPFSTPFVYNIGDRHLVSFPFLFQIVSIPFYKLFGLTGLYIIPLVALWVLWIRFFYLCRSFSLKPAITNISLATLIFACPLLVYGSLFWEHTLAVLLAFTGFEYIVKNTNRIKNHVTPKLPFSMAIGILTGLSVWFRPEAFIIPFLLLLPAFIFSVRTSLKPVLVFISSAVLTAVAFWLVNWALTGHIFGIHGIQVLESQHTFMERALAYYKILKNIHLELIDKFPVSILCLLGTIIYFVANGKKSLFATTILIMCFCVIAPALLPNSGGKQWGPRYFLLILPIITFLIACQLDILSRHKSKPAKFIFAAVFLLATCFGIYKNSYQGVKYILDDRKHALDIINHMRKTNTEYVVTNSTFISIGLAALQQEKTFFSTEDNKDFHRLISLLKKNGVSKYLYIKMTPSGLKVYERNCSL